MLWYKPESVVKKFLIKKIMLITITIKLLLFCIIFCLLFTVYISSADNATHVGAATCGSSKCHAAKNPWQHSSILQNEFVTWSRYDRHSKSYQTLLGEKAQQIALKLGMNKPHQSAVCLNCHADNVSASRRGKRFKIEHGVQCEVCHGGARKWLGPHSSGANIRSENLQAGMYPTENPRARAKLCLSCHLGSSNRQVTHDMYMAGHPRLRFELDTYTVSQPAHFRADSDYYRRKNISSAVRVWAIGQSQAARLQLENLIESLSQHQSSNDALIPELSYFDCHACHRQFDDLRWQPQIVSNIAPGTPRLTDTHLLMLKVLLENADTELESAFTAVLTDFHQGPSSGYEESIKHASRLLNIVNDANSVIEKTVFNKTRARNILDNILQMGQSGYFLDYVDAEQATLAVATILSVIDSAELSGDEMNRLYSSVDNEREFTPESFRIAMSSMAEKFK